MSITKTILVDFDGVLAKYHGWQGPTVIGEPVPGAQEFLQALISMGYDVQIYSTRCSTPEGRKAVEVWLQHHNFLYTSISEHVKPLAFAIVDDRAVHIPTNDGYFLDALHTIKYREMEQDVVEGATKMELAMVPITIQTNLKPKRRKSR